MFDIFTVCVCPQARSIKRTNPLFSLASSTAPLDRLQVPGTSSSASPMVSPALHSAASMVSMGNEPAFMFFAQGCAGSDGAGNGVPRHTSDV